MHSTIRLTLDRYSRLLLDVTDGLQERLDSTYAVETAPQRAPKQGSTVSEQTMETSE